MRAANSPLGRETEHSSGTMASAVAARRRRLGVFLRAVVEVVAWVVIAAAFIGGIYLFARFIFEVLP